MKIYRFHVVSNYEYFWFFFSTPAYYDANCTWRGQLPIRSHNQKTLSMKVFLGGVPWDITENNLIQAFRPFGNIRIEWPGKDSSSIPKGYLYVIFEHDKQVRSLLSGTKSLITMLSNGYYNNKNNKKPEFLRTEPRKWFFDLYVVQR